MGRNARMARRQRWSALSAACLLVASLLALDGVAAADPVREARERLSEAQSEAERAEARLAELERDGSLAVERYNEVRERLDRLEAEIATAFVDLRETEADLADRERLAGSFVRTLYQRGSAFELAALLGSESVAEVQIRAVYLRSSAESQYALVAGLSEDRLRHAQMIAHLRELRDQAEDARTSLAREREAVERLIEAHREELAELEAVVAEAADELADAEAERRRQIEEERRRRAAEEAARRTAEEAARRAAQQPPPGSTTSPPPTPATTEAARIAVDAALSQLGKPYQFGASGPNSYDCSGLTMWAWRHAGVNLPRTSGQQFAATQRISRSDLRPGDLVFFGSPIHHMAMYIGNGRVVEAPFTGEVVRINERSLSRSDITGYGRPRT